MLTHSLHPGYPSFRNLTTISSNYWVKMLVRLEVKVNEIAKPVLIHHGMEIEEITMTASSHDMAQIGMIGKENPIPAVPSENGLTDSSTFNPRPITQKYNSKIAQKSSYRQLINGQR